MGLTSRTVRGKRCTNILRPGQAERRITFGMALPPCLPLSTQQSESVTARSNSVSSSILSLLYPMTLQHLILDNTAQDALIRRWFADRASKYTSPPPALPGSTLERCEKQSLKLISITWTCRGSQAVRMDQRQLAT